MILRIPLSHRTTHLTNISSNQGQLEVAVKMQQEILSKQKQMIGADYQSRISAMKNLASTLAFQNKPNEAVSLQEEILSRYMQILGDDH